MSIRLGRTVFIKVDNNGVGGSGASWVVVGQQTDGGMDMKNETIDGTTKSDYGWSNDIAIGRSWTVTCEGKLEPTDTIYQKLYTAWSTGAKVWIQIDRSGAGGVKYECQAYVELSEKYALKDAVGFTATFACQGQPAVSLV